MDPPSSFEGHASNNVNQAMQTDTITCMELNLYEAAVEGKSKTFEPEPIKATLQQILSPNRNTVLHVHLATTQTAQLKLSPFKQIVNIMMGCTYSAEGSKSSSTNFVGEILDMCPSLLLQANAKSETPLHIAARYGHAGIVTELIERAKSSHQDLENGIIAVREMLGMTNVVKDTALHEAVRYNHHEVVQVCNC